MKHMVKKNLIIAAAVFAMITASVSSVFAATQAPSNPTVRPVPGSAGSAVTSSGQSSGDTNVSGGTGSYKAKQNGNSDNGDGENSNGEGNTDGNSEGNGTGVTRAVPTPVQANPAATMNVVAEKERTDDVSNKKYVSRGAFAIWIILAMLINALFSFWVGNRFYKMSKKDTHITSEIRALRRDIDEKFVGSVGGFSEQETDITNSNEDYSYDEGGITQRPAVKRTAEEDEEFKKWESRLNQRPSDAARRKKYQPERKEEFEDEEEEKQEKGSAVKNKAKELLGDIFPFNED